MTLLTEIQDRVKSSLDALVSSIDLEYGFRSLCPLMYDCLREFVLREGKNIRSSLFVIGYLGFSEKIAPNLYRSAAALELAHDFVLIHDDIIDKADIRRGGPALHRSMGEYIRSARVASGLRGEDLSLVLGDILFALATHAFLSIETNEPERKLKAHKMFLEAAFFTGSGQFIELVNGLRRIPEVSRAEIYRTYDLKTANYTFAGPLAAGAVLGGAAQEDIDKLFRAGILLGRAFQIRDDILDLFPGEPQPLKTAFKDVTEAKKTILLWYAYHHSKEKDRLFLDDVMSRTDIVQDDVRRFRDIVVHSGSLLHAEHEIRHLLRKACGNGALSNMNAPVAGLLTHYAQELLLANSAMPVQDER